MLFNRQKKEKTYEELAAEREKLRIPAFYDGDRVAMARLRQLDKLMEEILRKQNAAKDKNGKKSNFRWTDANRWE